MKIEATFFGKTKLVRYAPHNMNHGDNPDVFLWVERGEDYYALSHLEREGKKVAVIKREDWIRA